MRSIAVAVFTFLACVSSAVAQPWTAAGSSADVDESAVGIYAVNLGSLAYLSTSTSMAVIIARFNVTSTGSSTPAWTKFEILANNANLVNGVTALLYSVSRTSGTTTLIGSVGTAASPSTTATATTLGPSITFDFNNNYYFAEVWIGRDLASQQPSLKGVRVY